MPAKNTKKATKSKRTTLSLKPVETRLKAIVAGLKKQLHQNPPDPKKAIIKQDIKNVQGIIDELPNNCHKIGPYDLGI